MKRHLVRFLDEEIIGNVTIGCSREHVLKHWGTPDNESVRDNARIFKYGPIQLSFLQGPAEPQATLKSIELIFDADMRRDKHPDYQENDPFWALSHMSEREFRDLLRSLGISVHSRVEAARQVHLFLPKGMRVSFEKDELRRISHSTPQKLEGKQVSAYVSAADFDAIHEVSKQLGISIAGLCSRWISEGLHKETSAPTSRAVTNRRV